MVAAALVAGVAVCEEPASKAAEEKADPIFGIKIPAGYRDWKLISVAHEAGDLNDLRAVLGNDVAITAYRDGKRPFPDGAIIAQLAWIYTPSDENNKVFGRDQSFVAGVPTNVQFMVKDSKKYAATGRWGFAQFKDGQPASPQMHRRTAMLNFRYSSSPFDSQPTCGEASGFRVRGGKPFQKKKDASFFSGQEPAGSSLKSDKMTK